MRLLARALSLVGGAWLVGHAAGTPGPDAIESAAGALLLVAYIAQMERMAAVFIRRERALDRLLRELQRGA